MPCSGEQKEQFENPFEVLAQLEFEISLKNHAQSNFSEKIAKNHKSLGRDLKEIFLPNKKHFSLVHDGIRNFLGCGPEDLFLTSPPTMGRIVPKITGIDGRGLKLSDSNTFVYVRQLQQSGN